MCVQTCVYMHVHACVCRHIVCTSMWRPEANLSYPSSGNVHLVFQDRISPWDLRLDQLVSKLWGSSQPRLSAEIISTCHQIWILFLQWAVGIKLRASCLCGRQFTH